MGFPPPERFLTLKNDPTNLPKSIKQKNKKKILNKMKKGIHPENYRLCAFRDMSNGETFITHSTADTKDTVEIDGVTYPLIKLEISSYSHPFYTGKVKLVDTAGRVDKFRKKYGIK